MLRIAIFRHVFLDFTAPKAGDYIFVGRKCPRGGCNLCHRLTDFAFFY